MRGEEAAPSMCSHALWMRAGSLLRRGFIFLNLSTNTLATTSVIDMTSVCVCLRLSESESKGVRERECECEREGERERKRERECLRERENVSVCETERESKSVSAKNGLFLHERIRLNRVLSAETTVEV